MKINSKIYIAGHNGMVGSAIYRNLVSKGYSNIVARNSSELEYSRQLETVRIPFTYGTGSVYRFR